MFHRGIYTLRFKFTAFLALSILLSCSEHASAYKLNSYREDKSIRTEASKRKINLIPIAQAQAVSASLIHSNNIKFIEIELTSKSRDFAPVYKLLCSSGNNVYDIEIDALTGDIISFH